jgi:hypothetical protein
MRMEEVVTSYMEMIYIDSDNLARHTNVRTAMDTNALTWAAFNRYRSYDVPPEKACFLLDYHNAKGDLGDTICLDATGFEAITGQKTKTDAEYRKIDDDYWAVARKEYAAERATVQP